MYTTLHIMTRLAAENEFENRWDIVFKQLVAEPRRQIIVSLLATPAEQALSVVELSRSMDGVPEEQFEITLRHSHLPQLAETGYIAWDKDRGLIERGQQFDEIAAVVESLLDAQAGLPEPLRDLNAFATHDTK